MQNNQFNFDHLLGKKVMIRTFSAGVHFGTLKQIANGEGHYMVELEDARRVYSWTGALSLSELAAKGSTRTDSKLSVEVPRIMLQAIEVIQFTEAGFANFNAIKPFEP